MHCFDKITVKMAERTKFTTCISVFYFSHYFTKHLHEMWLRQRHTEQEKEEEEKEEEKDEEEENKEEEEENKEREENKEDQEENEEEEKEQ